MKLYHTTDGPVIEDAGRFARIADLTIDQLFTSDDPVALAAARLAAGTPLGGPPANLLAPLGSQEVWAAGVTYKRSRSARMEESKDAGGGTFYDRVYSAERPELFFKATPHRVVGPGQPVRLRADSRWDVPEPELTLAITAGGRIFGCTVGNDMSSRSIEGENPLYLPQAKVYAGCAALGPCLVLGYELPGPATGIRLRIERNRAVAFEGATSVGELKRTFAELRDFLYRENSFPRGAYLMTGTGIVPGNDFTLKPGDRIEITIDGMGTLVNPVGA